MDTEKIAQYKILIIDDDEFMLELVTTTLQSAGFKAIQTAKNGRLALAILDNPDTKINLILCDLNMPEMDGVELLRHLASRNFSNEIILFSGESPKILATSEKIAQERHLNVLGALNKPFNIDDFIALLEKERPEFKKSAKTIKPEEFTPTVEDIAKGIENDEFILFYQPQVQIATRKLVGFEALVRWQHPEHGILGPYKFVELAEQNNLIGLMTTKTIIPAIEKAKEWQTLCPGVRVSYNLSAMVLTRLDIPELIEEKVREIELDPHCFMIEVTESQLIEHLAEALEILTRLSLKRFGISIDDFGTGYSSLKQLQEIPFTELKIDRAFVYQSAEKPISKAILNSSTQLAKSLNIETVAEGVETQEDWNQVAQAGCDIVQGYFVSKPLPAEDVPDWIKNWR